MTAPVDARLPGGGGNQICGNYDVNPAKFGVAQTVIEQASHYGKQTEVYDGIDAIVSARIKALFVTAVSTPDISRPTTATS